MTKYQKPDALTMRLVNPLIATLTKLGLSVRGAHVLAVRGRKTGTMQEVPVNPVEVEGMRYLVAPRGDTHWVRNLRVTGAAELRIGQRREHIQTREIDNAGKPLVLRAYLRRWKREIGKFFGMDDRASDEDLTRIAPDHPVFQIT